MWVIENLDDYGEGMFLCDAPTRDEALRLHREKNGNMKVTSISESPWVDLALVTGERGESCYFQRQRSDR